MINLVKIVKNTKRVGRGNASGKGKTSGRGMNGQKSRTGASTTFTDGGQTKFFMRLPKAKGFKRQKKNYIPVNAKRLEGLFKADQIVSADMIKKALKIDLPGKVKLYSIKLLKDNLKFDDSVQVAKTTQK